MSAHAATTVDRPVEEVRELWRSLDHPLASTGEDVEITFKPAPGDRGTEIHVEGEDAGLLTKLFGSEPLPKLKDGLRRFKQLVETGEIARSDGTPEGELAERKLKQRPAQPLEAGEREKAGV